MSRPLKIMISAGEASGDRLGAGLARAVLARRPDAELIGMGGAEMAEAGVRLVQDASEVAVVGITEVLSHLPELRRAMGRLETVMRQERPDLLVPVDFPDFNLRLCARAGRQGVPVVYFVSPQVWAWRRGRVRKIRGRVERMLVLFPFETELYREAGVPVTFVGHPAVESRRAVEDREALLRRAGLDPAHPVVALLPGSRRAEIRRLLPILLGAAQRLRDRHPQLQFLVPLARTLVRNDLAGAVEGSGLDRLSVHSGDYPQILEVCEAGAVASGTASLEAALADLPMVVIYKVQPVSHLLGLLLLDLEHKTLPNLIAGRRVVPELFQGQCTAETVADALSLYLENPQALREVRKGLAEIRNRLGPPGVFERAADAVLAHAERSQL